MMMMGEYSELEFLKKTHGFLVFLQAQHPLLELCHCGQQAVHLLGGLGTVRFLHLIRLADGFPQVCDILRSPKESD